MYSLPANPGMKRRGLVISRAIVEKSAEIGNVGDMHLSLFPMTHEKRSRYVAPSSYHDLYPETGLLQAVSPASRPFVIVVSTVPARRLEAIVEFFQVVFPVWYDV